jgi:hypothetical protein
LKIAIVADDISIGSVGRGSWGLAVCANIFTEFRRWVQKSGSFALTSTVVHQILLKVMRLITILTKLSRNVNISS